MPNGEQEPNVESAPKSYTVHAELLTTIRRHQNQWAGALRLFLMRPRKSLAAGDVDLIGALLKDMQAIDRAFAIIQGETPKEEGDAAGS